MWVRWGQGKRNRATRGERPALPSPAGNGGGLSLGLPPPSFGSEGIPIRLPLNCPLPILTAPPQEHHPDGPSGAGYTACPLTRGTLSEDDAHSERDRGEINGSI